jgi:integrase
LSSVYIVPRPTRTGDTRYSVRAELVIPEGRRVLHLGTYGDERLAWKRKLAVLDVIAGHATDAAALGALTASTVERREMPVSEVAAAWLAAREDSLAPGTFRSQRQSCNAFPAWLAKLDWRDVRPSDVQRFATERGKTCKRGTVRKDLGVLRQVLDFAALDYPDAKPNPASLRRLHVVKSASKEYRLPTRAQLAEIHEVLASRSDLMTLLECTGLRIEEAAALRWDDFSVDPKTKRQRLRVRVSKTRAGVRFVEHLEGAPPFPVRRDGGVAGNLERDLVFRSPKPSTLTNALARAHAKHGTFLMSAHEFRHLAASRWLHEGVLSPAEIAARLGHTTPAVLLTTYAHVVPPD